MRHEKTSASTMEKIQTQEAALLTPFNGGIPQATNKAVDDGAYSDHLTFWTKTPGGVGNSVAEKLRIASNGNVGIGTTTPGQKLDSRGFYLRPKLGCYTVRGCG
jgi:hypothetical protein